MSVFDDVWRTNAAAFDRTFGDPLGWLFSPMALINGRPTADPTRAEIVITAARVEQPAFDMPLEGKRIASNTASPIASSETIIDFMSDALPFDPKNGDRIRELKTGALYEVDDVRPDGAGVRVAVRVFRKVSAV